MLEFVFALNDLSVYRVLYSKSFHLRKSVHLKTSDDI